MKHTMSKQCMQNMRTLKGTSKTIKGVHTNHEQIANRSFVTSNNSQKKDVMQRIYIYMYEKKQPKTDRCTIFGATIHGKNLGTLLFKVPNVVSHSAHCLCQGDAPGVMKSETKPNNVLLRGYPFKFTISLQCLII